MDDLTESLLGWFGGARRDLPWRTEPRDPYHVWVSEVMLQQTTVDVVAPRFLEFIGRFPRVSDLAAADTEDVTAAWAGLGYYRRARALHEGARVVCERFGGSVPASETSLLELPGVGPYTAAAIVSLAFNRPAAPLDGNVVRVLSRWLAEKGDVTTAAVRRRLTETLRGSLPNGRAALFAEALIELGALVCRPVAPLCGECPLSPGCRAKNDGAPEAYPRKKPRRDTVAVRSTRAVVARGGMVFWVLRSRDETLLPGFWELPGRWGPLGEDPKDVLSEVLLGLGFSEVQVGSRVATARHAITHHRITSEAYDVHVRGVSRFGRFLPRRTLDPTRITTESRKLLGLEVLG